MSDDEWYTPLPILRAASGLMGGIDLDPTSCRLALAATPYEIMPEEFFDKDIDALTQTWEADTIWMNPPYSRAAGTALPFVEKLLDSEFTEACVLVNASVAAKYYQLLLGAASAACFCSPRVKFDKVERHPQDEPIDPGDTVYYTRVEGGSPRYDNTIFYIGPHPDAFEYNFEEFGTIWRKA